MRMTAWDIVLISWLDGKGTYVAYIQAYYALIEKTTNMFQKNQLT